MASMDELFDSIPIDSIAKRLGVKKDVAEAAVRKAVPGLVSGLKANADDAKGAESLQRALGKHRDRPVSRRSVDEIDTDDGDRIVSNVFGERRSNVTSALADAEPKADASLISKVLPMIAPIVMAWLAKKFTGGSGDASGGGLGGLLGGASGGGLGGLLGGMLGGGSGGSGSGGSGSGSGSGLPGGLGDALGGLLGGGKR